MKSLLQKLITALGRWLHGTTGDQWNQILTWVTEAERLFVAGPKKFEWVKQQIAVYVQSPEGRALLGGLSQRALTWLIETAVGFLSKK